MKSGTGYWLSRQYADYEDYLKSNTNQYLIILVKVIESRPVSNQIAEDIHVKHESPQMIYIQNKSKAHMTAVLE
ncbi:monothiol bacilliredoxin BrxC family protein [Bacillus sp. FJAT-28004]|uniref:monothiol bacilliredoxin BrxC family protein n=1 Tax=Bacillus sp. FJAT-28004 TaxID=1679165 RepID=UPI000AD98662|nr:monothiol bacilliredoxin BrxC family protein [Bacillus sp. FJAT-28004]